MLPERRVMKTAQKFSQEALTHISVCLYLLSQHSYRSQEAIRRSLRQYGFSHISQATVSRLLKRLGVIKARNARGIKVYTLARATTKIKAFCPLADMVVQVESNQNFILIHTRPACASYIREVIKRRQFPAIIGMIARDDRLWITLMDARYNTDFSEQLANFLCGQR